MELKGEEGSLVSNSTFREPSETLDRHHHHQQNPSVQKFTGSSFKPVSIAPIRSVRYRECLKNHAASVGGNVLDGCGEFMPCGDDGTFEALKCAACNCHRNFHRKETDHGCEAASAAVHPLQLPPPLPSPSLKQRMSVGVHANHWTSFLSPVKMTFAGGGSESSSDDLNFNNFQSNAAAPPPPPPYVLSKKRYRTKFTPEQKNKMLEFAEKVGWRIPREDDVEVQRFCAEVGVKRQVFKVWMHNNKNSTKKQIQQEEP